MKILWTVNMVFPEVAKQIGIHTSASGGWLLDLANSLASTPNIELATLTYYNGTVARVIKKNNITHYLFPGGGKRLLFSNIKTIKDCKKVIEDFKPDLIHIQGTEYAHSYHILDVAGEIPIVLTIQGILTRISEEYYGGMNFAERFKILNVKDLLKFKTLFHYKWLYTKNAKRERKILNRVKYVTGRTDWDKAFMFSINPSLKYYRLNYNLRSEFYEVNKWNIKTIKPHTIITGAANYSLKGLHVLIKALFIVKKHFPTVLLYIPGSKVNNGKLKSPSSYQKYIIKLIDKLKLNENVIFLGKLSAEEVANKLAQTHLCVVPSAIEGASATLCEAMFIGTPSICSYRGGMTDLISQNVNGFTYDYSEYPLLAYYICELFKNNDLSIRFSKESIKRATLRHNRQINIENLISTYNEVTNY